MVNKVTIKVEGMEEFRKRMRFLSSEVNESIARGATNAAAQVIKRLAIEKAPVGDPRITPDIPIGQIRDNIIVRYIHIAESGITAQHVVTVRKKAKIGLSKVSPYRIGVFQEFGTVHHGKRAFLRPAFLEGKDAAFIAMKKRITARLKQLENKWGFK
jgi:HK97 gp10 family phage protein